MLNEEKNQLIHIVPKETEKEKQYEMPFIFTATRLFLKDCSHMKKNTLIQTVIFWGFAWHQMQMFTLNQFLSVLSSTMGDGPICIETLISGNIGNGLNFVTCEQGLNLHVFPKMKIRH